MLLYTGAPTGPAAMTKRLPSALTAILLATMAVPMVTPAHGQAAPKTQRDADAQAEAQEQAKRAAEAKEEEAKAPPPAIPGATGSSVVAPADKLAADMSPNDALFDSINRGDAAGARDALNRGAQIDAKNVLGQSPIDASIDSNRTDITFLLLSMRGASPAAQRLAAIKTKQAAAAAHLASKQHPGKVTSLAAAHHLPHAQTATIQNPGTPNPSVGFIGF